MRRWILFIALPLIIALVLAYAPARMAFSRWQHDRLVRAAVKFFAQGDLHGASLSAREAVLFPRRRGEAPQPVPSAGQSRMGEGIAVLVGVLTIPPAALAWFSRFENARAFSSVRPVWTLSAESLPSGWTSESVAPTEAARNLLRFTEWQSFTIRDTGGIAAQIVRLGWERAARTPAFVTNHTPAVCMPASGWAQTAPPFLLTLKIRDGALPCAVFPFERDGVRILALQSLSAGGPPESRLVDPAQIPGGIRRFATLWQEPMRQITEELLLYIPDPGEAEARKNSATEFLNTILSQHKP
ncbi:MAG: hypothetical protein WCK55_02500 [Verrucomicrobiota bacterium]